MMTTTMTKQEAKSIRGKNDFFFPPKSYFQNSSFWLPYCYNFFNHLFVQVGIPG